MQKECIFQTFNIKSVEDCLVYENVLSKFNFYNPFNSLQLMRRTGHIECDLCYFMLSKNGSPIIIMPFFYRKIRIKNIQTPYFDVASPYGYSGPSYNKENEKYLNHFWELVDDWYKQNKVVSEFIRFNLNNNYNEYTGKLCPTLLNVRGIIIDPEILWHKFKPKVRNNYRKAVNDGLEYKIFYDEIDEEIIDQFYAIYISTMERNGAHTQYFYNKEYFMDIVLKNKKRCSIAMIYLNNIPISTEFILLSDDTAFSYLGGTLSEYFNSRPNDFLKFNTIKWLYDDLKIKYYVLGGGRKDGDGLYNYKKSFFDNDEDVIFYTGKKIIDLDAYNELTKLMIKEYNFDEKDIQDHTFFPLYRINDHF